MRDGAPEGWRIFGRIRVAVGSGALVLGAAILRYGRSPWSWGIVVVAALVVLLALYVFQAHLGPRARRQLEFLSAALGLALCLCLVQAMGGVAGPFAFVYLVPVFAYGLSFGHGAAYRVAAACSALMVLSIAYEARSGVSFRELLAPLAVLHLTWAQAYGVDAIIGHESARREELVRLADIDPLTGLMNRRTLQRALEHSAARDERFALLLLDLDGFKSVNDQFGHVRGDEVLRAVAQATQGALRKEDVVIRYGGDEFAVLVKGGEEDAMRVEDRLRGAIQGVGQEMEVRLGFSAGVAVWPDDGATLTRLLQVADGRLYQNKPTHQKTTTAAQGDA